MMLAPLMHGAAQWSAFTAIAEGATIILPPNPRRLDPVEVWRTVERERATKISMVGDTMGRPLVRRSRPVATTPLRCDCWSMAGRR